MSRKSRVGERRGELVGGKSERRTHGYPWLPITPMIEPMTNLEYQVLAWLAAGNGVFRPRESTLEAEEGFREVVALVARLRTRGLVDYQDRHVMKAQSGIFLMVGPVALTPEGKAALEHDRQLGPRPPRLVESLPWRA